MDAARGIPLFKRDGTLKAGILAGALSAWAATTLTVKATALNRVSAEKTLLLSACRFGALAWRRRPCIRRAYRAGNFRRGASVVSITFTIWFLLIVRYSAARLSVFTFLTPLFGVAAGHVVLNQPLTPAFALAVSAGGRRAPSRQHAPVTLYAYRGLARRSCGGRGCAL